LIQNEIRPEDLLARLGGDEFSILLTNINTESTRQILHRIEASVKKEMELRKWNVSLSIGAMVFSVFSTSIESMLKSVDEIMYEVKNNGKNNIKIVEQIV
jgi:diguanylate cyclase (GGDEF)-like protein